MSGINPEGNIDFVVTWVDGNDPSWLEQFYYYAPTLDGDKRKCRFRDWDNLQYLFRAFDIFTPWVRKIHFVTWGHLPPWLNTDHPKLNIVRHDDFLDCVNLPVFSCNPIEINLHRIPGLADKFVYFNDDTFLLRKIKPQRFFRKGLPCDVFSFNALSDSQIAHIKLSNIQIVNNNFEKYEVLKKNFFKIFSYKYSAINILKTILLLPWPKITGFYDPHMPQPFLKKTFESVWLAEESVLKATSGRKIRSCEDVSQYLFRYWHLCEGRFSPIKMPKVFFEWVRNREDAVKFRDSINSGKYAMACINDGVESDEEFLEIKKIVNSGFEKIFPQKSSFEI